jgi:hypothetical protein
MSYVYFRRRLVIIAALSLVICSIVIYDLVSGGNVFEPPGARVPFLVIVVIANAWVAYMMLKAKKREHAGEKPDEWGQLPSSARNRRLERKLFPVVGLAGGLFMVERGFKGWIIDGIPMQYVGFFWLGFCVLALLGVNVWKGGPHDPQNDPPTDL